MRNIIPDKCPHCEGDISERSIIETALSRSDSVADAACRLNIGVATLYRRMHALGLIEKRESWGDRARRHHAQVTGNAG
jgi:transcriptional regulator of acetoin/glycerol metabolism